MKIITLKQPWATLIAEGYKDYEFRTWNTKYRGEILIHAGIAIDKPAMKKFEYLNLEYPISKIVTKVTIVDTIKLNSDIAKKILTKTNTYDENNYNRDDYAWQLTNVQKINSDPIIKGQLSIWNIDY